MSQVKMLFHFIPNTCKSGCMSTEQGMHRMHSFNSLSLSSISEVHYDVLNAAVSVRHGFTEKLPARVQTGV